jgi:hypothetical protein
LIVFIFTIDFVQMSKYRIDIPILNNNPQKINDVDRNDFHCDLRLDEVVKIKLP